jgi:hypothetical protein
VTGNRCRTLLSPAVHYLSSYDTASILEPYSDRVRLIVENEQRGKTPDVAAEGNSNASRELKLAPIASPSRQGLSRDTR